MTKVEAMEILKAPPVKWMEFREEAERICALARDEHGLIYCSNCINRGIMCCCPTDSPLGPGAAVEFCVFFEGVVICQ